MPLFECLTVAALNDNNIPKTCLIVLSLLTVYAPCLEAMVAERANLILLLQMLHSNPICREGALAVLYSLAGTPELAWAAAKHGGVVYILELILPLQGKSHSCMWVSFPNTSHVVGIIPNRQGATTTTTNKNS